MVNGRWTKSQRHVNFPVTGFDPFKYSVLCNDEEENDDARVQATADLVLANEEKDVAPATGSLPRLGDRVVLGGAGEATASSLAAADAPTLAVKASPAAASTEQPRSHACKSIPWLEDVPVDATVLPNIAEIDPHAVRLLSCNRSSPSPCIFLVFRLVLLILRLSYTSALLP